MPGPARCPRRPFFVASAVPKSLWVWRTAHAGRPYRAPQQACDGRFWCTVTHAGAFLGAWLALLTQLAALSLLESARPVRRAAHGQRPIASACRANSHSQEVRPRPPGNAPGLWQKDAGVRPRLAEHSTRIVGPWARCLDRPLRTLSGEICSVGAPPRAVPAFRVGDLDRAALPSRHISEQQHRGVPRETLGAAPESATAVPAGNWIPPASARPPQLDLQPELLGRLTHPRLRRSPYDTGRPLSVNTGRTGRTWSSGTGSKYRLSQLRVVSTPISQTSPGATTS